MPNNPQELVPNMRANPMLQNIMVEIQKSTTFLIATLILFLARTKPVSRQVNPACMSRTSAVQISIQMSEDNCRSCVMGNSGLLCISLD